MSLDPILTVVGGILIAAFSYLGARFTARQSAKSAARAADSTDRQVDVDEWRALVKTLQDELARISLRVDALEKRRDVDRALIESLEADLQTRDARHRTLLTYVREVIAWARLLAPDHSPPPAPASIADELTT